MPADPKVVGSVAIPAKPYTTGIRWVMEYDARDRLTFINRGSHQSGYKYDANSNLTSDGLRQFSYDAANRLSSVQVGQSSEASKITYLHNSAGQRVFKSEPQVAQLAPNSSNLGDSFITWLQANFGWLFAQAQVDATLGQSYVYADSSLGSYNLLGEYGNGGSQSQGRTEYLWLPAPTGQGQPAQLIGIYQSNRFYAAHTDHLGTPRRITDDAAQVVWQWSYSAFGDNPPSGPLKSSLKTNGQSGNVLKATAPQITMNLRMSGQYADVESGQFYNYYRNYQPQQGRYTQNDPIGLGGRENRFLYVDANPLGAIDPDRLKKIILLPPNDPNYPAAVSLRKLEVTVCDLKALCHCCKCPNRAKRIECGIDHRKNVMQILLDIPAHLPDAVGRTPQEFAKEATMAMAVKLYELKRLSSGMAAALAGIERVEFLSNLHHYGVPLIDSDADSLASDVHNA